MRNRWIITLLPLGMLCGLAKADSTTLLNMTFDNATAGVYANNSTVSDGSDSTQKMSVSADTNLIPQVTNVGSSNQVFQFTDNSTTASNAPGLNKSLSGITTSTTGNDYIVGGFDFTYLASGSSATMPQMQFLISNGLTAGGGTSDVQLLIRGGSSGFSPTSGTTAPIVTGDLYHLAIALDLSSDTQDTWSLVLTNETTSSIVSSQTLNTRATNIVPTNIAFYGGVNGAPISSDPYIQLDNVSFSATNYTAIPEPSTAWLLAPAAIGLALRRRRAALH